MFFACWHLMRNGKGSVMLQDTNIPKEHYRGLQYDMPTVIQHSMHLRYYLAMDLSMA